MENTTESKTQNRLQQINELREKIEAIFSKENLNEIQNSITASIEQTQEKVGNKIDAEVKKTLKGTMQFLNGAKGELEGIQKKILKLMGGAPKKKAAKGRKQPVKKTTKARTKAASASPARKR